MCELRSSSPTHRTETATTDKKKFYTIFIVLLVCIFTTGAYVEREFVRPQPLSTISSNSISNFYPQQLLTCDAECRRFRSLMANDSRWSDIKPRAAIVMLLGRQRYPNPKVGVHLFTDGFASFAYLFDRHFNDYYNYPLVIFYEPLYVNETERQRIRNMTRSDVFYQPVFFALPPFINLSAPLERCTWASSQGVGYKHMCRFHAKFIYDQPILKTEGLEYVWRLDDDSFLVKNLSYDPIWFMKERRFRYGHLGIFEDDSCWVQGLWKVSERFWDHYGYNQRFPMPEFSYFYNNFEISALSVWRSVDYQLYFAYIDRLGGIYYHRWGDGPIKSIAVSRLLDMTEIYQFEDIAYRHNMWKINM